MDGQLFVIVKIHPPWALEIIIIEIQWDLRPVIWDFLLMTSIIGDNRLLVHSNTTLFLRMMIKIARQILPSYGKNYDKITKLYP